MIAYTQGETIGRETTVTTIRLDLKGATSFPEWVFTLSNLQELHLFNARFGRVHFMDWPWPALEKLKLTACGLEEIVCFELFLDQIRSLDFSDNSGLDWPAVFLSKMRRLEALHFSRNQLGKSGLEGLGNLRDLRSLYLDGNDLPELPDTVFELPQLRILDISDNRIGRLKKAIGKLVRLDQFQAGNNRIKTLPESVGELETLSQLQLQNNQLTVLPDTIRNCITLRKVDLSRNKIRVFPEILAHLPWLNDLNLAKNRLKTLPAHIGTFTQLSRLDLSSNLLNSFMVSAEKLPRLRELNLDRNKLTTLTALPGMLYSISLARNELTELPMTLMNQTELKEVNLEGNLIRELPRDFGQLESGLIRLGMAGNPVRVSASDLLPLRQLKELSGLMSAGRQQELLLAQHTARTLNLPASLSDSFYQLLRGNNSVLSELTPDALLLALNHPVAKVVARVRQYVQQQYGLPRKGNRLKRGSVLAIVGRTFFDKTQLEEHLDALGIALLPEYDPIKCTHLLLGFPQIHQEIPPAQQVILNEKQLVGRLDRLEKKTLLQERSEARLARLRQLITSPDTTNIRLGFRMIQGNGLPPSLWNELLVAYYLCERDPALQLQIKSYLRLRLVDEGKNKFFAALTPQLIKWGKIKPEKEELLRRNRFDLALVQSYLKH
ncbi:MAG: leucine-rich repeat domain-containing protein [Saprospiraceae bacterium]